jgi:hypothetical protein
MTYQLYDYVNAKGVNEFKEWTKGLQNVHRAKLNSKLDFLAMHGENLPKDTLTNTGITCLFKLRVHGNVQLRPLLCKAIFGLDKEYTLIKGATERDSKWDPPGAPDTAHDIKVDIIRPDLANRRIKHERVS